MQTISSMVKFLITTFFAFNLLLMLANSAKAETEKIIKVVDDNGVELVFTKPASRIVTLVPHASELLFEIGAGNKIVAAVDYSDYPEQAKSILRVGGYSGINIEKIVSLRPDLVIYWKLGNNTRQIEKLKQLGLTLYSSNPKGFESIAHNLRQYGAMTGHSKQANKVAENFLAKANQLKQDYSQRKTVKTFYQVWHKPLTTQGKYTFINQAIEVCGGESIFSEIELPAPQISIESVFQRDPQVIVASGMGESRPDWLDEWQQYKFLSAVKNNHLYHIHPDLFHRPTSRFLQGTEQLCKYLDKAR